MGSRAREGDGDDGGSSTADSLDLVCFSLIIDDIVYWDGRTSMCQVGGGGPQVLWGYAAADAALRTCGGGGGGLGGDGAPSSPRPSSRIALAAGVGEADFPPQVSDWLSGPCLGADTSGLRATPGLPTPRAWQLLEQDGRRTQVWRCADGPALYAQLRPPFASLPERLRRRARSYHIGLHASHPPRSLLRDLRRAVDGYGGGGSQARGGLSGGGSAAGGFLSAETYTACDAPLSRSELRALLEPLDVFSPNEEEAASMLGVALPPGDEGQGDGDDEGEARARADERAERLLLDALLDAAPGRGLTVVLRRGKRGAMARVSSSSAAAALWAREDDDDDDDDDDAVPAAADNTTISVPACADLTVVDPVGCGNAFCGAFLAAAHHRGGGGVKRVSLREAVAWGCAAGGTMSEFEGVPRRPLRELAPVVERRARALGMRVQRAAAAGGGAAAAKGRLRRL
jgi:sugar/nucleoside kinase (ribokinase family)